MNNQAFRITFLAEWEVDMKRGRKPKTQEQAQLERKLPRKFCSSPASTAR